MLRMIETLSNSCKAEKKTALVTSMGTIFIFSLPRRFFKENPNENQNKNLRIHKIRSFTKLHENFTAKCERKVLLHLKNDNK